MYAPDGRTIAVLSSEVEAYQNVGWYLEPVTLMYAPDGRTLVVAKDEVSAYQNVGWYTTYQEAMGTNKPIYSANNNTRGVYRTQPAKDIIWILIAAERTVMRPRCKKQKVQV